MWFVLLRCCICIFFSLQNAFIQNEYNVRIATQIVADAFQHNCDLAIVVSADSDMIPAVELAKEARINVFIYFPPHQYSSNMSTMGNGPCIQMLRYENRFKKAVLPDTITLRNGYELTIPEKWKALQLGK